MKLSPPSVSRKSMKGGRPMKWFEKILKINQFLQQRITTNKNYFLHTGCYTPVPNHLTSTAPEEMSTSTL